MLCSANISSDSFKGIMARREGFDVFHPSADGRGMKCSCPCIQNVCRGDSPTNLRGVSTFYLCGFVIYEVAGNAARSSVEVLVRGTMKQNQFPSRVALKGKISYCMG
ncbi:MAG: hypothetical protein Ct9H90mP5_04470 [Acidimicrobiaceae bacterium]|nr:MAG: hypothetical protein Ct9H90mP5_04470 [Acidimicrobiaceae bacterium]